MIVLATPVRAAVLTIYKPARPGTRVAALVKRRSAWHFDQLSRVGPEIADTDSAHELTNLRGDVHRSCYQMSELCNAAGVDAASNRGRSDAYGAQVQILRQQHEIFAIDRLGERVTPPLAELLASSVAVTDRELLKVVALSLAGLLYIEGLTWARLP